MDAIVKEPAAVAMPESLAGVIGIFFFIRLGMMPDMVAAPLEGRVLQRPPAGDEDTGLDPVWAFEALVRYQPVIADGDTHACDDVQGKEQSPIEEAESVVIAIEWETDRIGNDDGAEQGKVERQKTGM